MGKFAYGETRKLVGDLCDGNRTAREIAQIVGLSEGRVQCICRENNFSYQHLPNHKPKKSAHNIEIIERIKQIANGKLSSLEIAAIVGSTPKYVQRVMLSLNLPRLRQRAPMYGLDNPAWVGGRRIDLSGYVLVDAPEDHPHARKIGSIYEHRLVVESKIGRYLLPTEVVDHLDGITVHNHPENLRLFASNTHHLKATISERIPSWSEAGRHKLKHRHLLPNLPQVDKHRLNLRRGDVRLRNILRAWLLLDKDSPYLCGTHHWLEQAGITDLSRSSLELHLQDVLLRMERPPG